MTIIVMMTVISSPYFRELHRRHYTTVLTGGGALAPDGLLHTTI